MFVLGALRSARGWSVDGDTVTTATGHLPLVMWSRTRGSTETGPRGTLLSVRLWSCTSIQREQPRMFLTTEPLPAPTRRRSAGLLDSSSPVLICSAGKEALGSPTSTRWTVRGRGHPIFKRLHFFFLNHVGADIGCLNTSYVTLCGPPCPLINQGRPKAGPWSCVVGPALRTW